MSERLRDSELPSYESAIQACDEIIPNLSGVHLQEVKNIRKKLVNKSIATSDALDELGTILWSYAELA